MNVDSDNNSLKHRYGGVNRGVMRNSSDSLIIPLAQDNLMGTSSPGSSLSNRRSAQRRSANIKRASSGAGPGGAVLGTSMGMCLVSFLAVLMVLALGVSGGYFYMDKRFNQKEAALLADLQQAQAAKEALQNKVVALESANRELSERVERGKGGAVDEEKVQLTTKVDQLVAYKKRMHHAIQHLSKQRLLEKFGPGPHRLEILLAYHPESNAFNLPGGDRIVIELAPVDEMPHTVYWYLEQVDRKLWDGTSFHRNAHHVVQGGPVGNFLTPPNTQLAKQFKDSGFNSVLFQEYSHNFPHLKYTMGFAGRPGGPDFYISTV